jgi:hypothetical protein
MKHVYCCKYKAVYFRIRADHWILCRLTHHLNVSLCGLFLAFYLSNLYFLWSHLMCLTWPPISSGLYLVYQFWAFFRQLIRFGLVTVFAARTAKRLTRPLRQAMSLNHSQEAKKIQVSSLFFIFMSSSKNTNIASA